ncbi:MAG TPA: DoxX family protein [Steroidobacteraceae bacterium]
MADCQRLPSDANANSWSGFNKFSGFEGTVSYIAGSGLPVPAFGAIASIIVELGGGRMLAFGYKAPGCRGDARLYRCRCSVLSHLRAVSADQAQNALIHFMKNVSMVGGLLYVVVHGPGPVSLDRPSMR